MTPAESMHALAEFVRRGDESAFAAVVRAHIDLVYAAARRQVIDPAGADDVTQAVFVLLARNAGRLPAGTLLPGWLLRATKYCAADANRARRRRLRHEKEAAMAHVRSTATRQTDPAEVLDRLDAALAALRPTDRAIIAMRYLQERPLDSVAVALGVSTEAAKKRAARAIERLRGKLAPTVGPLTAVALSATLTEASTVTAPPSMAATTATASLSAAFAGGNAGPSAAAEGWAASAWKTTVAVVLGLAIAVATAVSMRSGPAGVARSKPAAATPLPASAAAPPASMPAARPTPAVAALSPEQRRVYDLLGTLRDAVAPFGTQEWVAALHDLVEIGKPAVPALCVELDRSTPDMHQRMLLMALRWIGDPRSVPTLIRAIPRVEQRPGGYGFMIDDPALRQFFNAHYWNPGRRGYIPDESDMSGPMEEIITALEAMTRHGEGHQPMNDLPKFPADRPGLIINEPTTQEVEAKRREDAVKADALARHLERRRAFATRWQTWWDAHRAEFATADGLAEIDAARFDGDLVAAVFAERPPLFPSGPDVRLTGVRQVDVPSQGLADVPAYFDFLAGRLLYDDAELPRTWFMSCSIQHGDSTETGHATLDVGGLKAWFVSNDRFDTIEQDVRAGQRIGLGNRPPTAGFYTLDSVTKKSLHWEAYPATYFFLLPGGSRGIIRIDGVVVPNRIRIRYRLWPATQPMTAPKPLLQDIERTALESVMKGKAFRPPVEAVIGTNASKHPTSLTFETGETVAFDAGIYQWSVQALRNWATKENIDVMPTQNAYGLRCPGWKAIKVSDAAWETLTPADAVAVVNRHLRLDHQSRQQRVMLHMPIFDDEWGTFSDDRKNRYGEATSTYVLHAERKRQAAVFQFIDVAGDAITVRYKLLDCPDEAAVSAAVTAATRPAGR